MILKKIKIFIALLVATTVSGCANDALPKPQKLGPLRVLGILADKPEANEGDSVNLTPIVSDFSSGPRTLTYSWKFCADPGIAQGASPVCSSTILAQGTGSIQTTEAPLTGAPYSGLAATDSVNVSIPPGTLASLSATQATNGIPLIFTFELTGGTESTQAFRRIIVTSRATLNTNVSLLSVSGLVTNGAIQDFPASKQSLTPVLGSSADTYTVISSTGETLTRTEKLTVSWFTTDGEFEFSRTDGSSSNQWTPPSGGSAKGLVLLRDDRGGLSTPIQVGFN
ncbi:hypothetical protein EBZ37_10405 [bacterium]|nr:hypothetical protein [bacterium]